MTRGSDERARRAYREGDRERAIREAIRRGDVIAPSEEGTSLQHGSRYVSAWFFPAEASGVYQVAVHLRASPNNAWRVLVVTAGSVRPVDFLLLDRPWPPGPYWWADPEIQDEVQRAGQGLGLLRSPNLLAGLGLPCRCAEGEWCPEHSPHVRENPDEEEALVMANPPGPDERMRRLERAAQLGDPEAARALEAMRRRVAQGPELTPAEAFLSLPEGPIDHQITVTWRTVHHSRRSGEGVVEEIDPAAYSLAVRTSLTHAYLWGPEWAHARPGVRFRFYEQLITPFGVIASYNLGRWPARDWVQGVFVRRRLSGSAYELVLLVLRRDGSVVVAAPGASSGKRLVSLDVRSDNPGRPTPEEVALRLFGPSGSPPGSEAVVPRRFLGWLRHVFAGRLDGWVDVWGARHTTRRLAATGALEVEPLPGGYERIRLTPAAREEVGQ